jgi:hypothetical protein
VSPRIRFHSWSGDGLRGGDHEGTALSEGLLVLDRPRGVSEYDDPHRTDRAVGYEQATWTSPAVDPGFGFTELVPSWNARTPAGTWVEVSIRLTTDQAPATSWYPMARWAESDSDIAPTSVPGVGDEHAKVDVDRLALRGTGRGTAFQLRVTLHRRIGSSATPSVALVGCVASDLRVEPGSGTPADLACEPSGSAPSVAARGTVLDVPCLSQRLHLGGYPRWGGGGESWCSPTSTSMVLAYWGLGPVESDYAWVEAESPDRFVPHAARHTYDHAYEAPGNWSFNAAYAGRFGATAYVTRLRSLDEAELFLAAGIPLVVGLAFSHEQLDGAGYTTSGHLAVIAGFDEQGDVVCNDPASHHIASNDEVRVTYDREQFERAWVRSAGRITYVIRPSGVPLPQAPDEPNW